MDLGQVMYAREIFFKSKGYLFLLISPGRITSIQNSQYIPGESFRKGIHLRYESRVTVLLPLERSHRSFASFKPARLLYHSFPFFVIPSLWFLPFRQRVIYSRTGIPPGIRRCTPARPRRLFARI